MKIPFVDLFAQYTSIKPEIDQAIQSVITETAFIGGKYVEKFEKEFAELYGVKNCIAVGNGTDSLYIIMKMLGVKEGDEVVTVANSWISSSETISQTGATPVFVDIDKDFYSIDTALLEKAITPKTKAIIPVHLQGQICDMETIMMIANKYNIPVIEDCAQSHFSEFNGKRAGLFGIAASFSFYPGKNLGAYGDAGCIITNDDQLARKFKMFARHGAIIKHQHEMEGINSRLDGMQAAILSAKLPYILKWTEQRIHIAKLYDQYLSGIDEIVCPKVRPNSKHTFHLYVLQVEKREELAAYLKENGIETAIHYPSILPALKCYEYLGLDLNSYKICEAMQPKILSLPIYPELTEDMVKYVSNKIKEFYSR